MQKPVLNYTAKTVFQKVSLFQLKILKSRTYLFREPILILYIYNQHKVNYFNIKRYIAKEGK